MEIVVTLYIMRCVKCYRELLTGDINLCYSCKNEYKLPQGWECPRCYKIHSYLKMSCDCEPKTTVSNLKYLYLHNDI